MKLAVASCCCNILFPCCCYMFLCRVVRKRESIRFIAVMLIISTCRVSLTGLTSSRVRTSLDTNIDLYRHIYLCNTSFIVYVRLMIAICLIPVQQSFYDRVQRWQQTGSRRTYTLVNKNIGIKFSQHDPFLESYNGQSIALTTRTQRSLYVIQK